MLSTIVLSVCLVMDFGLFQWPLFALSAEIQYILGIPCHVTLFCGFSLSQSLCDLPQLLSVTVISPWVHSPFCTFTWCALKWTHHSLSTSSLSLCWNYYTYSTALCSKYEHDTLRSVILHQVPIWWTAVIGLHQDITYCTYIQRIKTFSLYG